ncbi:MAG TPA: hypothetical protein DEB06_10785, partial [Phycisphaerales bacterium]|nr:hypothetical protein [Phycisphaerales bacterium]
MLKSGAPVLPVVIEGTPQVDPAWASLAHRSRARVRVLSVRLFESDGGAGGNEGAGGAGGAGES